MMTRGVIPGGPARRGVPETVFEEDHSAAWHEIRAADLLRPPEGKTEPSKQAITLARAHTELARSMRLGEVTGAIRRAGNDVATAIKRSKR